MKLYVHLLLSLFSIQAFSQVGHQCTPTAIIAIPAEGFVTTEDEWSYVERCNAKIKTERERLMSIGMIILSEVDCRYVRHPHSYGQPGAYGEIKFIR